MTFHPSVAKALRQLKEHYPNVPLAAFGQTVFWDEPTKSVLIPMLQEYYPDARILTGPHDADYFGKCPGPHHAGRFVIKEHNDGPTRNMWASVGEVSALFGAEVVPTRAQLIAAGVDFQRARRGARKCEQNLIDACTTAWGWRAVVESGNSRSVCRDVATREVLPLLEELIDWALRETLAMIASSSPEKHQQAAADILATFDRLAKEPENADLTKLYQHLWPYFYSRLLGHESKQLQVTSTFELFRFNRSTCALPRFGLVAHFLNARTAAICREAYSSSLEGSGIYALERFGPEALPFELVVPGRGRGTIALTDRHLVVDTEPRLVVDLAAPIRSLRDLAAAVEGALGAEVALVGKAVALAFMFTSEFVFVLNQEGSPYVSLTKKMAKQMGHAGIPVKLNPILRLGFHTWDSLADVAVGFHLPEHLARAFGEPTISARKFARRWRGAVKQQEKLLKTLSRTRCFRELMELLGEAEDPRWLEEMNEYVAARARLLKIQQQVAKEKCRANELRQEMKLLKSHANALQRERGKLSRHVKQLRNQLAQQVAAGAPESELVATSTKLQHHENPGLKKIDDEFAAVRQKIKHLQQERRKVVADYRALETGCAARQARKCRALMESKAEAARLCLAAQAIRVTRGLPYTNHRPTAWWLLVADPSGCWYQRIVESTELSLENMV